MAKVNSQFTASEIKEALIARGEFMIPGVGKIKVVHKGERNARNPQTGAAITVAAHKTIKISPAGTFKDTLNGVTATGT